MAGVDSVPECLVMLPPIGSVRLFACYVLLRPFLEKKSVSEIPGCVPMKLDRCQWARSYDAYLAVVWWEMLRTRAIPSFLFRARPDPGEGGEGGSRR